MNYILFFFFLDDQHFIYFRDARKEIFLIPYHFYIIVDIIYLLEGIAKRLVDHIF